MADASNLYWVESAVFFILILLIIGLLVSRARMIRARQAYENEHLKLEKSEAAVGRLEFRISRLVTERALGAVVTTIAHEVNQPLIAIQNYAQAAAGYIDANSDSALKLNELLGKIERESGRAGTIIHHVRMAMGPDGVELERTLLPEIIGELTSLMRSELGDLHCRTILEQSEDVPPVLADALQVQIVLTNLLINAARVQASSTPGNSGIIRIRQHQRGEGEVQVSVVDSGPGVSADCAEHLFEPFATDAFTDGMSIGLSVCKTLIGAQGGRIWHTPNPAGGAMFHFTLRVAR